MNVNVSFCGIKGRGGGTSYKWQCQCGDWPNPLLQPCLEDIFQTFNCSCCQHCIPLGANSKYLLSFAKHYCTKKNELSKTVSVNKMHEAEVFPVLTDDEILQRILTEKEKDACVQSKLSKEYLTILKNSVNKLDKSGIGLILEPEEVKSPCWDEINVNHVYCLDNNLGKSDQLTEETAVKKDTTPDVVTVNKPTSTGAAVPLSSASSGDGSGNKTKKSPMRLVRGEPGKVICAFIPEEWFRFFIPKTGVTGMGTFFLTFSTYLVSKEKYVLEHNYYNGLGMFILVWATIKYLGPALAKFLDKEIDEYEVSFTKGRKDTIQFLEDEMAMERFLQFQSEGQLTLIEAKRENVALQLEAAFRERQLYAHEEIKKRLDHQVQAEQVRRRYLHKNLVDYVQREVLKAISPDMQDKLIYYSIDSILKELEKQQK